MPSDGITPRRWKTPYEAGNEGFYIGQRWLRTSFIKNLDRGVIGGCTKEYKNMAISIIQTQRV